MSEEQHEPIDFVTASQRIKQERPKSGENGQISIVNGFIQEISENADGEKVLDERAVSTDHIPHEEIMRQIQESSAINTAHMNEENIAPVLPQTSELVHNATEVKKKNILLRLAGAIARLFKGRQSIQGMNTREWN